MDMSAACTPPINAPLRAEDESHPRYAEYLSYRSTMARQMVYCMSFKNWLNQVERSEATEARDKKYPRELAAWRAYLRAYYIEHGNHNGALDFDPWMKVNP